MRNHPLGLKTAIYVLSVIVLVGCSLTGVKNDEKPTLNYDVTPTVPTVRAR